MSSIWTQRGADIDGEATNDRSGFSGVSLSSNGSVVAIGALYNSGNGTWAGQVRIYEWNGSAWIQRGADIDGEAAGDQFGESVSLSADGSIVAIGGSKNDGNGVDSGHVRVYEWNGTAWVQRGADINGEAAYDRSGYTVSMSSDGSVVAIGATTNDGTGANAGHVRVYEWNGSAWVQRGADIDGEAAGDESGYSLSLSSTGSVVAIGARLNDGNGADSGHVRVYEWSGSAWVKRGADIDGEAATDYAGHSVSLSADGSIVAIGAILNDASGSNSGQVRVYEWSGSAWVQRGADIDGEAANDRTGSSVSLSSDGSIVAIGADGNDGSGSNAGYVRVYGWNGTSWTKRGDNIYGEAAGDNSGIMLSLSSNGSIVAIGAPYNDGSASNAGHVRVYAFLPTLALTNTSTTANQLVYTVTSSPVPDSLTLDSGGGSLLSYSTLTGVAIVSGLSADTPYTHTFSTTDGAYNNTPYTAASARTSAATTVAPPCFLGSARLRMADGSWCRIRDLTEGAMVAGVAGEEAATVTRVIRKTVTASPAVNPYVIPAGQWGARRRLLISPAHRVAVPGRGLVPAEELGLKQHEMDGEFDYYNVEIEGNGNMNVEGVEVESLAPVRRLVVSKEEFVALVKAKYGHLPLSEAHRLIRETCRQLADGRVEIPVVTRR